MAIIQGAKAAYNITAAATTAGEGTAPDRRRLYDFSNRVLEIKPKKKPFFVFLSGTRKVPTTDPVFRFLQNRTPMDFASRAFRLAAAVNAGSAVTAGSSYGVEIDDGSGASIDWVVKGNVIAVNTVYGTAGYSQIPILVNSEPVKGASSTSFTGLIIDLANTGISGYNVLSDNDIATVIGSAYVEGSGAPDAWSAEIEDDFGNCQIFKTSVEMTETAMATVYRGYPNEWVRINALKFDEHGIDIERGLIYGLRQTRSNVRFTEGIVGHILKNANPTTDDAAFSYTSDAPYYRSVAATELIFDRILLDFEILFDPARGGSEDRLVLASLPNISFFNRLGNNTFLDTTLSTANNAPWQYLFQVDRGSSTFGHKLLNLETVHGTAHLTAEPVFRGQAMGLMAFVDLSSLAYRPLIGNGINHDTHVRPNVQAKDEDLRKDLIYTEAGLEIGLPETHMLYNVEGYTQVV